jgi:hypothetical protein
LTGHVRFRLHGFSIRAIRRVRSTIRNGIRTALAAQLCNALRSDSNF